MVQSTAELGGTASGIVVGKVAHGLMMMTWREDPVPDEQCFEAIKAGIDALPPGTKMFLNGGEFYGHNLANTNLEMIARFFEKYPEYADRTFLSIKGGLARAAMRPDGTAENLRASVDNVIAKLRGTKRLDLFQCGRVDPDVPIEDSIATLSLLIKEGKFDHIGMSECKAETLRRGHSVHPITVVEIEVSPWCYEEETKKVIAAAKDLNISVAAYSPLGRGFLTGQIKRPTDIPANDMRHRMVRFQAENWESNFALVDALSAIATRKNCTPAQLCIAWVSSLGQHVIPLPGSSHVKRTLENSAGGDVKLTEEDLNDLNHLISTFEVKGPRFTPFMWG